MAAESNLLALDGCYLDGESIYLEGREHLYVVILLT